jgi:hypothetical protein
MPTAAKPPPMLTAAHDEPRDARDTGTTRGASLGTCVVATPRCTDHIARDTRWNDRREAIMRRGWCKVAVLIYIYFEVSHLWQLLHLRCS